jgi:hypothetical protein
MISICPFLQSYVTCHQTMSLWKTFTYTPEKTARSAETSVYAYSLVLRHNISCQTIFYVYGRYSNTKIMRIIENGPKVLMKGSALNWSFFFKFDDEFLKIKFLNTDLHGSMPLNTDSKRPLHSCVGRRRMSPEFCILSL